MWGVAKAVPRRKFIAIQAYLKKHEKYQINNPTLHLKEQEKKEQTEPKVGRSKNKKNWGRSKQITKINEPRAFSLKR